MCATHGHPIRCCPRLPCRVRAMAVAVVFAPRRAASANVRLDRTSPDPTAPSCAPYLRDCITSAATQSPLFLPLVSPAAPPLFSVPAVRRRRLTLATLFLRGQVQENPRRWRSLPDPQLRWPPTSATALYHTAVAPSVSRCREPPVLSHCGTLLTPFPSCRASSERFASSPSVTVTGTRLKHGVLQRHAVSVLRRPSHFVLCVHGAAVSLPVKPCSSFGHHRLVAGHAMP
jgi:hypothetical protein